MASRGSYEDADLILKLYDLRREAGLRAARQWITHEFWPQSADEILAVFKEFGSEHNQWFRQVTTYWEMACSFVNRGILDRDLFIDSGTEPIFIYAKLRPFLQDVRNASSPNFLSQISEYVESSDRTRKISQYMEKGMSQRAHAAQNRS